MTIKNVPVARFDLQEEVRQMRSTARPGAATHIAKTLVRTADLRLVLIVMQRGARIHDHHTEGRLSIQGIDGVVQVRIDDAPIDLAAGHLLALDRDVPHALEAIEDSSILITISWQGHHPEDDATRTGG